MLYKLILLVYNLNCKVKRLEREKRNEAMYKMSNDVLSVRES